jgi:hypothetical protein
MLNTMQVIGGSSLWEKQMKTGQDYIQYVCDRMDLITSPWTIIDLEAFLPLFDKWMENDQATAIDRVFFLDLNHSHIYSSDVVGVLMGMRAYMECSMEILD